MILADLGADVVKVERPGAGDDTRQWGPPWIEGPDGRESAYFLCVNRNKRSITADLSDANDRAIVAALASDADVVVENFAPGTLARWGLDHETLATNNPGLVTCSITGYGSRGPDAGRPGYDFAVQARAGWMAVTGEPEGSPMKVGVAVVDVLTGQNAAIGVMAALRERERSGRGQRLEVSLLDSAVAGLVNAAQAALVGRSVGRYGNAHPSIVPYQAFATADRPIVVAVGNDAQWRRLCTVLGVESAAELPRYATNPARVENREALVDLLQARFRSRGANAWLDRLDADGVPCAPVRRVEEAVRDPAFLERGGLWPMEGATYGRVEVVASPIRLERTPARLRRGAPALGEQTDEVATRGWRGREEPEP